MKTNQELQEIYEKHAKSGMVNQAVISVSKLGVGIFRGLVADWHAIGSVPNEPSIFTFHHATYLDAPFFVQYLSDKGRYTHGLMDTRSFARAPLLHSLFGEIPFDTKVRSADFYKWSLDEANYWLGRGHSILVSNDGGTIRGDKRELGDKLVSDLHARIAIRTGKKVVPVSTYVHDSENLYILEGKTSWKELVKRWRLDYFVGFSEPIDPKDFENSKAMAEETKKRQLAMNAILRQNEKEHRKNTFSWAKYLISKFKRH